MRRWEQLRCWRFRSVTATVRYARSKKHAGYTPRSTRSSPKREHRGAATPALLRSGRGSGSHHARRSGDVIAATAQRLGVHVNTISYRLRQCEELLERPVKAAALRTRGRA